MTRRLDLIAIAGAAVAIVIHLPPEGPNVLHDIFADPESPTMKLAEYKEAFAPGTICLAPPGCHLLVESGRTFALSQDDRVHYSRPAPRSREMDMTAMADSLREIGEANGR